MKFPSSVFAFLDSLNSSQRRRSLRGMLFSGSPRAREDACRFLANHYPSKFRIVIDHCPCGTCDPESRLMEN